MAHKAGVILLLPMFGVTFGTVVHLHAVPRLFVPIQTGDALSPYVPTVAGQAIFLVHREGFILCKVSVTGFTPDLAHFHMGDMGKINAVRLFGINQPGDFLISSHILCEIFLFIRGLSDGEFGVVMAHGARGVLRNPGKRSIISKPMAKAALLLLGLSFDADVRVQMKGVVEIDGLFLLGV